MHGLLSGRDDPLARLLVTDDRAYDLLAALLPEVRAGMIGVVHTATRCLRLLTSASAWTGNTVTAMVSRDLGDIPVTPLPKELTLRPVRRLAGDEADGVPLDDAVAAAISADPRDRRRAASVRRLPALTSADVPAVRRSRKQLRGARDVRIGCVRQVRERDLREHTPRVAAPRHRTSDDGCGASCCSRIGCDSSVPRRNGGRESDLHAARLRGRRRGHTLLSTPPPISPRPRRASPRWIIGSWRAAPPAPLADP